MGLEIIRKSRFENMFVCDGLYVQFVWLYLKFAICSMELISSIKRFTPESRFLLWNIARTAFPNIQLNSALDKLCIGSKCTVSLRVLAATFQAYHASKPFSAVFSTVVFDAAKRRFEDHFYVAVRSSGLAPKSAAD